MTTIGEQAVSVALPGDEAFAAATRVFNLSAPAQPAAAVIVRSVEQVRAAIRHARSTGLPVRVHATGHAAAATRPVRHGLLIRTQLGGGVDIDTRRRVARIPAGTCWGAVVEAAAVHGLAVAHGSSPTVGVVGYVLRGGLSFYGRHRGLAANSVRAVELVTADGELRRVDATADPELFWALRGGGGGFGVVTAVEVDLFPAAKVITGAAFWPAVHAEKLLRAWQRWTLDAPPEATTTLRVMNLPSLPGVIPPALSAGTVLCVDGAVLSAMESDVPVAQGQADSLLGPLRSVAEPVLDTWQPAAPPAVLRTHMDPAEPVPLYGDHLLLGELGDDGAAAFLRVVGEGSGSPLINAELRQLGGAFSVPNPAGGVLDHLDARYAYLGGGMPGGPVTAESILRHCAVVRAALSRWDTGLTAPTLVETFEQPQGHLGRDQVAAVDRVRARVDPAGLFRDDIAPGTSAR
jgi:FAD/FMN-containing dehydrogenase